MTVPPRPTLLVVDDSPDDQRGLVADIGERAHVKVVHPEQLTMADLAWSSAVLVDLRLENWPERDATGSIGRRPVDGVAVATLVRRSCESELSAGTAPLVGVRSAHLEDISEFRPPESRPHAVAQREGLDWAFPKTASAHWPDPPTSIVRFTHSAFMLRNARLDGSGDQRLCKLLGLTGEEGWYGIALDAVIAAHAPEQAMNEAYGKGVFARWLLHRILPYPSVLVDSYWMAVRLRVEPSVLAPLLVPGSKLWDEWRPFVYKGVFEDFLGARWWRDGFEVWASAVTGGRQAETSVLLGAVANAAGATIARSAVREPVFALDASYRQTASLKELSDCVAVQLPDWPHHADQVWLTTEAVDSSEDLQAIVLLRDRAPEA